jgi:putative PIN family toxin of toxin-antitoxin system
MKAVLDTNVLISALIKAGKPRRLLNVILGKDHTLIFSEELLDEFLRVSTDKKIRNYADDEAVATFLKVILSKSVLVRPEAKVGVFNDADDNVLSAAGAGGAGIIVTGDKHILDLKRFGDVRIVSVGEALAIVRRKR